MSINNNSDDTSLMIIFIKYSLTFLIGYISFKLYAKFYSPNNKNINPISIVNNTTCIKLTLTNKIKLTPDTFSLQFESDKIINLPIGQHIQFSYKDESSNELIIRSYTPVNINDKNVDVVIKMYYPDSTKNFNGGLMTMKLDKLSIGDSIDAMYPKGKLILESNTFTINGEKTDKIKKIGMIAGGSGITPMYQILDYLKKSNNTNFDTSLIFANKTIDDIILRSELENNAFINRLWYTLDVQPSVDWDYDIGYVNELLLQNHLPTPGEDVLILVCGPPPFVHKCCVPLLKKLGYTNIFTY